MWIIHVKGPVGRFFKVVDTYIKPPMNLPVYKKERLEQLEQSLKAQKIEYEVETVKERGKQSAKQTTKQTRTVTTEDKVSISDNVTIKTQTKVESKESQTTYKQETQKSDDKRSKDNK